MRIITRALSAISLAASACVLAAGTCAATTVTAAAPAAASSQGAAPAAAARIAAVTTITKVTNKLQNPITLFVGENHNRYVIDAGQTKVTLIRVPWVGWESEMHKGITVYENSTPLYVIFQDYWLPNDQIMYSVSGNYEGGVPVPGGTGGGDKTLVISNNPPSMQ